MRYEIKKKTAAEFVGASILLFPCLIPVFFFFKSSDKPIQRVAIPPSRLRRAKLWMIFSAGYWWFYLRYFAKQCPECNCVYYKELQTSEILDVQQELYTYKDTVETKHYAGPSPIAPPIATSRTKVDKVGVKTLTTANNTYKCVNCGHTESMVETSQDLKSAINSFKV
jgi:hypothetical protein